MPSPTIETAVAHVGRDEHRFRGFGLYGELAGRTSYWQLLVLAVGGAPIDDVRAGLLDDLCTCATLADPRIPPLKIARLIGAWGDELAAVAALFGSQSGAEFSPGATSEVAQMLVELLAQAESSSDGLPDALRQYRRGSNPPLGFAAHKRVDDERLVAFRRCYAQRDLPKGAYWSLLQSLDPIGLEAVGAKPNIFAAIAAVGLDLGLTPTQVGGLAIAIMLPCALANVVEGVEQQAPVLRRLPDEWVVYDGPPPRRSPRARAADEATQ